MLYKTILTILILLENSSTQTVECGNKYWLNIYINFGMV